MNGWGFLSYHWIPQHRDATDRAWFALQQPRIVKVVSGGPEPPYAEDLPADSCYLYRDASFEFTDLRQDAAGVGHRNAEAMYRAFNYLKAHGIPADRILLENINEYNLWAPEQAPHLAAACDVAFCEDVISFGGDPVAGNAGVGWPGNSDNGGGKRGAPGAPPLWEYFRPVAEVLQKYHKGYLGAHEYWWDQGLDGYGMWGWWAGRILKCPFNVPILITECGIDSGVAHANEHQGWLDLPGTLAEKADKYIGELWDYMGRLAADPMHRIQAIMPFTWDFGGEQWKPFDVRSNAWKAALGRKQAAEPMPVPGEFVWGEQPPPEPPPPVDPTIEDGVDISWWQRSNMNWAEVAEHNAFCYIRASHGLNLDAAVFGHTDQATAHAPNVKRGYYHYLDADCNATTQGRFFATLCRELPMYLIPAIDIEDEGLTAQGVRDCISSYEMDMGEWPRLYYRTEYWNRKFGRALDDLLQKCETWIANAQAGVTDPVLPPGASTWRIWQWGSKAGPEWTGNIDRNRMKVDGTEPPPEPPPPEPPPGEPYHVTLTWQQVGGLYIIQGNYPVPGTTLSVGAWGNTRTAVAGHKPGLGAGGFEFSLPDAGSFIFGAGTYTWPEALFVLSRGVLTLGFS